MDEDIYLSKKKKDNKKNNTGERITSEFKESDFISEVRSGNQVKPSDIEPKKEKNSFKERDYSDEKFELDLKKAKAPEYHPYEYTDIKNVSSREPQGRPIKEIQPEDRAPKGQRVSEPKKVPQGRKKKKSKKGKVFLALFTLFLILVGALGVYAYSALEGINYEKRGKNDYISASDLKSAEHIKNILVIGCDARGDVEGNRSDTMILFSIDEKTKKIKLTSFLRDSYLYNPAKGYSNKLNSAFSYGGTDMLIDTLEYNFKIKIDNFVMVDFKAFRQLIDLMGGITVKDVTEKEAKYMRDVVKLKNVKAGTNKMNGKTALWYCRIRYVDNDFKRTERQRKVISAVIKKATKTNLFTLIDICKKILPNISTDITQEELMILAVNAALRYLRYDIVQQQIPADGEWSDRWVGSQQVVALDLEANQKILKKFLYE